MSAELPRRGVAGPLVSVVIPARDEARELPVLLDHLAALPGRFEVVLADCGSVDATRTIAAQHPVGAKVVETPGGRAVALNAAARVSTGDLILFLHADSRLPQGAYATLVATMRGRPAVVGGNFALRFDGGDRFSSLLGAVYAVQRRLGVYYGDSSIWVRRETFERLGGYRELPIMDDYDFVRRLERLGPTACLPVGALTSSRRWRALGIPRTVLSWVLIRWLFIAGVDPARLARLYPRVRGES